MPLQWTFGRPWRRDDRIGGMQGSRVAGDAIDSKLAGYRARLAAQPGPDGVMRELSDFDRVLGVKQAVQDDIGAAVRAGRNNEARELGKLVKELDAALRASRYVSHGKRRLPRRLKVIDAVDEGAMMATVAGQPITCRSLVRWLRRNGMRPASAMATIFCVGWKPCRPRPRNRAKGLLSPKRVAEPIRWL